MNIAIAINIILPLIIPRYANTSANKWVSSATIYLSDNTTFTTLADDTNYILRYVGGKLRVSN
jgi:hypothetical protein